MASLNGTDSRACPLNRRRCTFSEIVLKTLVHLPRRATMRGRSRVKKGTTRFMPTGWWAFVVQHLRRSWTRLVSRNVLGAACSACRCSWLMRCTGWTLQWLMFASLIVTSTSTYMKIMKKLQSAFTDVFSRSQLPTLCCWSSGQFRITRLLKIFSLCRFNVTWSQLMPFKSKQNLTVTRCRHPIVDISSWHTVHQQ